MSDTAHPSIHGPVDADVQWFGASQRMIGGQPDSRYGWLERGGAVYIVKAISPDLTAYAATLLAHERQMLARLQQLKAPAPEVLDVGRADWLVTRFAGLSLQRLTHASDLQGVSPLERFGFAERLAAWVYLLRRLQPMADAGVLAIDLYSANVVLPLTHVTQGQLRLHEAAMIDHAHTLEAGMNMRRPVWINHDMERIAPELKGAMRADMARLKAAFDNVGARLPGYSRLPGDLDAFSRRVWAEYDAPQQLQQLLDSGNLDANCAMQFAAGMALKHLALLAESSQQRHTLEGVLQRMTAMDASARFKKLSHAADALEAVVQALPLVSAHSFAPLQPQDLTLREDPAPPPNPEPPSRKPVEVPTIRAIVSVPPPPPPAPRLPPLPMRWLFVALALGLAWGTRWPLSWGG